jgi:hypothetical protein
VGALGERERAVMRPLLVALVVLAGLCAGTRARAFSDKERFPANVQEGGGGGRLFTGSPVDGYACNVCHEGGQEPNVVVYGLPIDGYVPGQTYDLEIAWNDPGAPYALHVEIVNQITGRAAGQLSQVDPATLGDARGRCGSLPNEEPADYILEGLGRQVIGVEACGASNVRFRFTAPNLPQVVFTGSVVRSDSSASAEGDGVQNLGRVLKRVGEPNAAESGCSTSGVRRGEHWPSLFLLLLLSALVLRARARAR